MNQLLEKNELLPVIKENGISDENADFIGNSFIKFLNEASVWEKKAFDLVITDVTQIEEMKQAREGRLALKNVRVAADKKRKELKAESLNYGRAVQSAYNLIEYKIKKIEDHLLEQEKFVERKEAERIAKLKAERLSEIEPFAEFVPFGIDFGALSDEDFQKTLNGAKLQHQAKIEQEAREEAERKRLAKIETLKAERMVKLRPYYQFIGNKEEDLGILDEDEFNATYEQLKAKKEKYDAEIEAQRLENERLKKEAEKRAAQIERERKKAEKLEKERQAKLEKERQAAQKKLDDERKERERIEAELKAKKEAEAEAERQRLEQIEKDLQKGDAAKFKDFISDLESLKGKYSFKSARNKKKYENAKVLIDKIVAHIKD